MKLKWNESTSDSFYDILFLLALFVLFMIWIIILGFLVEGIVEAAKACRDGMGLDNPHP